MSVVSKVFEKILDNRIRGWAERTGALSDLQGGFRRDRETVDQIFILNEIVAHRREHGECTFLTFIDVTKAYDRVWRPGLWHKLGVTGLGDRLGAIIQQIYKNVVRTVLVNGRHTEEFGVHAGVPQGAVLSPFLYAVYIDGLHDALREAGVGVRIFGRLVPLLLYADDIVLLARDMDEMAAMHRVVESYSRSWRFDINQSKTKIVVTGSTGIVRARAALRARRWELCGKEITVVNEYKYLGVEFGAHKGKWNTMLQRMWEKARSQANLLLWQGGGANGLRPRAFVTLWNAKCRPLLEYACEVWEDDGVGEFWVARLEALQYTFAKSILRLKGNVAASGVCAELGLRALQPHRQEIKLKYWAKLCNAPHSRLLSVVFRGRHAEVMAGGGQDSCLQSFRSLMHAWGFQAEWSSRVAGDNWSTSVSSAAESARSDRERNSISGHSSLASYALLEHTAGAGLAQYLDDWSNRDGVRLMTKCRLGYLMLMGTVSKLMAWPRAGGQCVLCGSGEIEDVPHFLQDCVTLTKCRQRLMRVLRNCLPFAGAPGLAMLSQFCFGGIQQLRLLLGSFPAAAASADKVLLEQHGLARWLMDKAAKNFLCACWRVRQAILGDISVARGCLVHTPSTVPVAALLEAQEQKPTHSPPCIDHRRFWLEWTPGRQAPPSPRVRRCRRKRSAFYTVWRGRQTGVFCGWQDCEASVANHPGALFRGFPTLEMAERCLALGPPH